MIWERHLLDSSTCVDRGCGQSDGDVEFRLGMDHGSGSDGELCELILALDPSQAPAMAINQGTPGATFPKELYFARRNSRP